jgi:capsular polysaccharide biosynthesis protein
MDHSISGHFGHFIGDCLCRMHAWEVARQIFGDVKLIIGRRNQLDYQDELFRAAGATAKDVIKFNGLIRCKRLLLATQSLGLEQYASPTSARLWSEIRDRVAKRDISLPDRIYLTRAAMPLRRLVNESDVERLFERHGFTVVRPDLLTIPQQIALVSNALLIAGPGGSGMFNVAFQGRMRSAFILSREHRLHLTEMLCCAGRSSDIWYHLGKDWPSEDPTADAASWRVDPDRLDSDVADWIAASVG